MCISVYLCLLSGDYDDVLHFRGFLSSACQMRPPLIAIYITNIVIRRSCGDISLLLMLLAC